MNAIQPYGTQLNSRLTNRRAQANINTRHTSDTLISSEPLWSMYSRKSASYDCLTSICSSTLNDRVVGTAA